jgi:biopolymer transport protein ExbD
VARGEPVPEALQQLPITVKDDGTVYVGTLVIRRDQVASEMRKLHAQFPLRPIAVRGDRRVVYGDVIDVLDSCRAAGYTDVRLISDRPELRLPN